MNPEIKALWIAELRNPESKQTTGRLSRVDIGPDGQLIGDCCLGVLCKLAVKAHVIPEPVLFEYPECSDSGFLAYGDPEVFDANSEVLPKAVQQWAGLPGNNPSIDGVDGHELANFNDSLGYDFSDIADLIEANF